MPERLRPPQAGGGVLIETGNLPPEVRKNAEIAGGGVAVVDSTDQREITRLLRLQARRAVDWEYRQALDYLNEWADIFKARFFDPLARLDRKELPAPVIGIDAMRIETLGAYTLVRNRQGLLYEITMNEVHFVEQEDGKRAWRYGAWGMLETLCHELAHLWQQNFGEHPVKPGKVYHNAEFVAKCESIGLHPKLGAGYHTRLADAAFAVLMREHGIAPPDLSAMPADNAMDWFKWLLKFLGGGKEQRGRSTLALWTCGCQKARVGTKEFHAQCLRCGNVFSKAGSVAQPAAGHDQTVYDADEVEQRMSWQDHEEGIYQPKIHSARIRELHELAILTGEPITILVDLALRDLYSRLKASSSAPDAAAPPTPC